MDAGVLSAAITDAGCPTQSVSVGNATDRTTWSFVPVAGATPAQIAAANNVIATLDPAVKNVVPFPAFIGRWLDAEYQLLMQKRAQVIAAAGTVNMHLVKEWDLALSAGSVNLNSATAQNFKANLVTAAVLTQARADVIFS